MAGGHQPVRRCIRRPRQHLGERFASGCGRAGNVIGVHQVHHPLEGTEDLVPPGLRPGQLSHQAGQGPDVLLEFPHGLVQLRDGDGSQAVLRRRSRRGLVPIGGGCEGPALGDVGVGGRLHVEVHRHPAAEQLQRDVLVAGRERFDDGAVGPPGYPFALETRDFGGEAEVHHHFNCGVRRGAPEFRHLALKAEPFGAPWLAPRCTVVLRLEVLPHCFEGRDRLVGNVPAAQGQGQAPAVDGGDDTFADEPFEADFRDPAVVMQWWPSSALGNVDLKRPFGG